MNGISDLYEACKKCRSTTAHNTYTSFRTNMLFTLMRANTYVFFIFKIKPHIKRKGESREVASRRKAFSFMNVPDTFSLKTNVSSETNYYIAFLTKMCKKVACILWMCNQEKATTNKDFHLGNRGEKLLQDESHWLSQRLPVTMSEKAFAN